MLLEFKIKNFRSFRDTQTLSMVASQDKELNQNVCPTDFDLDLCVVRSAVIYGANAAGKSNLIRALSFMRNLILSSAKESQQGESIPVDSFQFDKESRHQPSEFEITFSKEGIRYQYGFIINKAQILEEWLLAYPSGRVQQWFLRKYNTDTHQHEWKFSKLFKQDKKISEFTRPNVLFLSSSIYFNNEQLIPIFSWFQKELIIISSFKTQNFSKTINKINNINKKKLLMEYMNVADSSINDIILNFEKFSEDKLANHMPSEIKEFIKKDMIGKEFPIINFVHFENETLKFNHESDGTQKTLAFAGYWMDALEDGSTIIVDELDNSLHPLAVRFLITKFNNPITNPKNAQLIFSTHDTSLLDNDFLRRDQIWFVEKNKENSSHLYPLLDFSPRKNEALGKGYLQGRYGALPYIGEWRF